MHCLEGVFNIIAGTAYKYDYNESTCRLNNVVIVQESHFCFRSDSTKHVLSLNCCLLPFYMIQLPISDLANEM